jgi:hypothetical protein
MPNIPVITEWVIKLGIMAIKATLNNNKNMSTKKLHWCHIKKQVE